MKKTIIVTLTLVLLFGAGIALAKTDKRESGRVYVLTEKPTIKAALGVNHEFPGGFSTNSTAKAKAMEKLGLLKTEPVQIFEISDKPTCNKNGICEPGENASCADCKSSEPEPDPDPAPQRSCQPSSQIPWGIQKVNGGSGGEGAKVAVLDSGVFADHLDLKANIIDCKDATKRGIKRGCVDRNGHGTHVAGSVLANSGADGFGIKGVAPQAELMAVKVCGDSGICYGDDVAAGIYYAADNGANIISMSLGGDNPDPRILAAIDYATNKDVMVVAAAGNDGPAEGSIDYPAAYAKVVAVGAIDSNGNVAEFSSRGVNNGDFIIEEREIEFAAPGVGVESTWMDGCYAVLKGTSMATPHVSGLAAKLWQDTAESTRFYLQQIAKNNDIGAIGDDTASGFGLPVAP